MCWKIAAPRIPRQALDFGQNFDVGFPTKKERAPLLRVNFDGEKVGFETFDPTWTCIAVAFFTLVAVFFMWKKGFFGKCTKCFQRDLNPPIQMTDTNNLIVREAVETEAEIRRKWEEQDRNRRTKTLAQNWPNRSNYEAQLQKIANVNKNQEKMMWTNMCTKQELEEFYKNRTNICGGGLSRSEARNLIEIIEARTEQIDEAIIAERYQAGYRPVIEQQEINEENPLAGIEFEPEMPPEFDWQVKQEDVKTEPIDDDIIHFEAFIDASPEPEIEVIEVADDSDIKIEVIEDDSDIKTEPVWE